MSSSENDLTIDPVNIERSAMVFRAINNPMRQQILYDIHKKGQMTVTELYTKLDLDQPVVSSHLAILKNAGFVDAKKAGRTTFYFINYPRLLDLHQLAGDLVPLN